MTAIMTRIAVEAAVRLGSLIETNARDAGRRLGEWLRPYLRHGEVLPDFTLVLQLPARLIEQAGTRLRESQKELDESRSLEGEAQISRDQKASALRRKLVEIRRFLTADFGPQRTAKLLGIEGKTAKAAQHALLLSQADAFLEALRKPKRMAKAGTAYVNPAGAVADLEPFLAAYREAYSRLDEVRQTSAARLEARDRARSELDRSTHWVVSILGGWLGLIRRADLAEKLSRLPRPHHKPRKVKKVSFRSPKDSPPPAP